MNTSFEQLVDEMNTTQTNLMNEILKQYLYWARFIINHESPFLTFDSATILALIESTDDQKLDKIVKDISEEAAVDFIKFRWKKLNFRNIVRYLELMSYSNIGNINISPMNGNGDGNNMSTNRDKNSSPKANRNFERYEIAIRRHLGKKWSTFVGTSCELMREAINDTIEARF